MLPHGTSPEFVDALAGFVRTIISENERKRRAGERERQILHEIAFCHREIRRLERVARRRPSVHRQVNELAHQIRHKELELAFLNAPEAR